MDVNDVRFGVKFHDRVLDIFIRTVLYELSRERFSRKARRLITKRDTRCNET